MEEPIEKAYQSLLLAIEEVRNNTEEALSAHSKCFVAAIDLLNHLQFALLQLQTIRHPPRSVSKIPRQALPAKRRLSRQTPPCAGRGASERGFVRTNIKSKEEILKRNHRFLFRRFFGSF